MSELNQNQSFNYSSFSDFCFHQDELPPETRHTVEVLLKVAGTDDYLEAFEDVCIVCDRPSKFSLDSENRLHAEGEPAIQFADGYGLYFYHGIPSSEN
ncbi:MAG: DUF6745 domain-containing protein [Cyanobacteria bacterium P01_H01_bin.150]